MAGAATRGGVSRAPMPSGQRLPARGTARDGMWSAAGVEPSCLLQGLFLQPGCCPWRGARHQKVGREGRMLRSWGQEAAAGLDGGSPEWEGEQPVQPWHLAAGAAQGQSVMFLCYPHLTQPCAILSSHPCVILSSFLSLLALCRTRHRESRQRLHEFGRPTVAAGSVPALPTQQMLIQIRIKNNNNNN